MPDLEKNSLEIIRIAESTYKDKKYVDLRIFFRKSTDDPDWKPTKKGLTIPLELLDEFKKAVNSL